MINKLFILICLTAAAICGGQSVSAKKTILMVHYGTTVGNIDDIAIGKLDNRIASAYPGMRIERAFTSEAVIRKLQDKGIQMPTPRQSLLKLASEGIDTVYIQTSNLLDGFEMGLIRQAANEMKPFFQQICIGDPLIYYLMDNKALIEVLTSEYADKAGGRDHVVFVGHGTIMPADAVYSQADHLLRSAGHKNFHVATIEGYPEFSHVEKELKESKAKKVTLVPFLFVSGRHVKDDLEVELKDRLRSQGYEVEVVTHGLGDMQAVQDLYLQHLNRAIGK